jgi:hypothetical protein
LHLFRRLGNLVTDGSRILLHARHLAIGLTLGALPVFGGHLLGMHGDVAIETGEALAAPEGLSAPSNQHEGK